MPSLLVISKLRGSYSKRPIATISPCSDSPRRAGAFASSSVSGLLRGYSSAYLRFPCRAVPWRQFTEVSWKQMISGRPELRELIALRTHNETNNTSSAAACVTVRRFAAKFTRHKTFSSLAAFPRMVRILLSRGEKATERRVGSVWPYFYVVQQHAGHI